MRLHRNICRFEFVFYPKIIFFNVMRSFFALFLNFFFFYTRGRFSYLEHYSIFTHPISVYEKENPLSSLYCITKFNYNIRRKSPEKNWKLIYSHLLVLWCGVGGRFFPRCSSFLVLFWFREIRCSMYAPETHFRELFMHPFWEKHRVLAPIEQKKSWKKGINFMCSFYSGFLYRLLSYGYKQYVFNIIIG